MTSFLWSNISLVGEQGMWNGWKLERKERYSSTNCDLIKLQRRRLITCQTSAVCRCCKQCALGSFHCFPPWKCVDAKKTCVRISNLSLTKSWCIFVRNCIGLFIPKTTLSDSYRMQHAQVITESTLQQLPHDRPTPLHFMSLWVSLSDVDQLTL